MPAIDTTDLDANVGAFKTDVKSANSLVEQAYADYEAAVAAVKKSNESTRKAGEALGIAEESLTKLRDSANTLLGQEGQLPPEIPEPAPLEPVAPIRGMRKK